MGAVLKQTWKEFRDDDAMTHAAALAFYSLLSLIPFMSLVLVIVGLFMRSETAADQILGFVRNLVGRDVAGVLKAMFDRSESYGGHATSIVGILVLLLGATALVGHLQRGLNQMLDVGPSKPGGKLKLFFKKKGKFLLTILAVAAAVIGLLALSFVLSYLVRTLGAPGWVYNLLHYAAAFGIGYLLISYLFAFVPDSMMPFREVRSGALITTVLLVAGQLAIGIYFRLSKKEQMYGYMASIILFVVWIYYSAVVLYFGAELTRVLAQRAPAKTAANTQEHT
jgi:membrane protein